MVRAILKGDKTQTRRKMNPQPIEGDCLEIGTYAPTVVDRHGEEGPGKEGWGASSEYECIRCPYGKPGDRIWVRETFCPYTTTVYSSQGKTVSDPKAVYAADGGFLLNGYKWKSSIFMPRWASRITLVISSVRVQRIQDISEEDAIAEGFGMAFGPGMFSRAFDSYWDEINGSGSWSDNPWVWCVGFRMVT